MMKYSALATALSALCLFTNSLGAAPESLGAAPETAVRSAPTLAAQEVIDLDKFLKEFHRAMEIKATKEMASITRRNPDAALTLIIEYGERISIQTNETLETDMAAFVRAWREAFDSEFGAIMYEYFALMKVQVRSFRGQRIGDFKVLERDYNAAIAAQDWSALDLACDRYEALAMSFVKAGDYYYASESWRRSAVAFDSGIRSGDANPERAGKAYAEVVATRKRIELEDRHYSHAKSRGDQLLGQLKQGADSGDKDSGGGSDEGFTRKVSGIALGESVTRALEFEMLTDLKGALRPAYQITNLTPIWNGFHFGKPGTTANILSFKTGPQGIRTGGGVSIDVDRDGTGDLDVDITGNVEPVEFVIGEGEAQRKWGFLAQVQGEGVIYQGIGVNLGVSELSMTLQLLPGASMKGEIDGVSFRVIDDNLDGFYGSQPLSWEFWGLASGSLQPEYDTIVVGKSKRAIPWSEYVQVESQWYQVLSSNFGKEIVTSKAQLETGTLKLSFSGPKPSYLIVRGKNAYEYCFFDVLAGGKNGIEVPAGTYSLLAGGLEKGKRKQAMKALILPGDSMKAWVVKPGETTTIEMGAPFHFEFDAEESSKLVRVKGKSVVVVGNRGERYERLWNCSPRPDVLMRKAGTKKSGRAVSMPSIVDRDSLFDQGFGAAWYPLDLELNKRKPGDEVELMLVEKKHKIFGKIDSEWTKP